MRQSRNAIRAQVFVLFCALLFCTTSAMAQAPGPPQGGTPMKDLLNSWNDIGRKLTAMAEDFPEDKYDWKPAPEVRSFAEQLLHAAGYANYVEAAAKGQKPMEEDPKRSDFKSKAEIVAYVKKAFATGANSIPATGEEGLRKPVTIGRWTVSLMGLWDSAIEHSGEHYGQLVVYYRVNKMVPPESRPHR